MNQNKKEKYKHMLRTSSFLILMCLFMLIKIAFHISLDRSKTLIITESILLIVFVILIILIISYAKIKLKKLK